MRAAIATFCGFLFLATQARNVRRWFGLTALVVALTGCAATNPPACYDIVGINPPLRFAIVFDHCRGVVEYQNLPPLPIPHVGDIPS